MRKLCSWVKKTPQKTKNCKQTRKMRYFFRMSDMEVDTLANMVADKLAVKVPDRVAHMKVNKVADMEVFKMADIVVSRPTRWSLWYWYLDVYVDHLYLQIQVTEKYSMYSDVLGEQYPLKSFKDLRQTKSFVWSISCNIPLFSCKYHAMLIIQPRQFPEAAKFSDLLWVIWGTVDCSIEKLITDNAGAMEATHQLLTCKQMRKCSIFSITKLERRQRRSLKN